VTPKFFISFVWAFLRFVTPASTPSSCRRLGMLSERFETMSPRHFRLAMDALNFQIASLTNIHWTMSGHAILMTIIGGVATLTGPLVGALVVASLENYLASVGSWVTVVQGAIFVFCVLMFRKGIVGEFSDLLNRINSKH
jgi:hypothetical protein